ncbi:MAG: hypothetical protein RMI56_04240 [Sulfolobales archaeon]|nr:hypothetical protein [Sulfolobales archaeon]MDW8082993.1 hypothetical protein [Sulfolobales archaeon]
MEGSYIPTVHVSLPEGVYEELKRVASSMGIQITDLIKMYIRLGLHDSLISENKLYHGENFKDIVDRLVYIEGKLAVLDETLRETVRKLQEVEERVKELESPIPPAVVKRTGGKLK